MEIPSISGQNQHKTLLESLLRKVRKAFGDFLVTERFFYKVWSLPLYIGMRDEEIDYVCEHIIQFHK